MAMLLALSATPEELEVVMLSVTYGNVPLQRCEALFSRSLKLSL